MTGYTMLSLHVWLLVRRLKEAGDEGKYVTQVMYDQFQRDTELRVHGIGIQVRACSGAGCGCDADATTQMLGSLLRCRLQRWRGAIGATCITPALLGGCL